MYENELKALKKANRHRSVKIYDKNLLDLASNDYLGLSYKKQLLRRAFDQVNNHECHSPKASLMVNGYHPIHKEFEAFLCRQSGFESASVAGSGFLANLALIEALPRKSDLLVLDEQYHASGNLASKLVDAKVVYFQHNDANALEEIIKNNSFKRVIVAVEGIYSMSGDIINKDIFKVIDATENSILIVDEAHSSGVLGENLQGVFSALDIAIKPNYIKMGTLGKAYGSYGAYILASCELIEFIQNRAKALIYATAPSVFDVALAHQGMLYILKHKKELYEQVVLRQALVKEHFALQMPGLILPLHVRDSKEVLRIQEALKKRGFLVGAIRPPTVKQPMLRVIPRLSIDDTTINHVFTCISQELV